MSEPSAFDEDVPVIMPVGKSLGANFAADAETGDEPLSYEIHLGENVEDLTRDEWTVWALAHERLYAHRLHGFTRMALSVVVEDKAGLGGRGDAVIDDLVARRVLASVDLHGPRRDDFLKTHRLIPTAMGLGGRAGEPGRRWMALNGETVLDVDQVAYSVWAFSYLDGSIWRGSEEYRAPKGVEPDFPDAFTLEEILSAVAADLPAIVASGCGYLEPLP